MILMVLIAIVTRVVVEHVINGTNSYSKNSTSWECYQRY